MSKRQGVTPTQSNTMLRYLNPPKPKKPKVEAEAGDDEEKGAAGEHELTRKVSPRPGPSTAPDNGSGETERHERMEPIYDPRPTDDDDSSQCSSSTQGMEFGPTPSLEEMEVDVLSESDEEIIKPKKRNRIQTVEDSSDSDSGTPRKPTKKIKMKRKSDSDYENSPPNKPKARKTPKAKNKFHSDDDVETPKNRLKGFAFQKGATPKEMSLPTPKKIFKPDIIKDIHTSWLHNELDFLQPDQIRDANRRRPNDPNYDPRTLYVPEAYYKNLTPAMKQWWELKSKHMDSVLFFKVGKFYELYHMDAVVGVLHLGFTYMKGEFAHSGFPESAYGKMANALIDKGFKVARVEQTETPDMMTERCKTMKRKVTRFDKVVKREVCQVSTKATCLYTAQMPEALNDLPNYMYAICMKTDSTGKVRFGVCFVETSIGTFQLSEFDDDKHFSRLLALFAEYPAALILSERGAVNKKFTDLMSSQFRDIRKDSLLSKSQFYGANDTLEKLSMVCYFRDKDGNLHWPKFFKKIADDCVPKAEYELAIRCLGACMWYLKDSKLDIQVFSLAKFYWYDPLDMNPNENKTTEKDYLILDSATINNLGLLGGKGTLQHVLDRCETAFGKRMLQRWICRPLCNIEKIKERQIAVNELWNNPNLLRSAQNVLKKMPDLERQLTKIHTYGNKFIAKDHPDGRAIFYEAVTYSKTKIKDFLRTLKALERAQELASIFSNCESRLLRKITQYSPKGANIDLHDTLQFFKGAFDQEEAEKEGKITPKKGVEEDFDRVEAVIEGINEKLQDYLDKQTQFFGCKISYFGNEKKRFQLDVPETRCDRVTLEYQLEGTKKGSRPTRRYSTPQTREMLAEMLKAESERAKIILDLNRRIFEKFSEKYDQFDQVIQCLTILDVLCSLAEYARTYSQDICIPDLRRFSEEPQLSIIDGRHPCIPNIDSFVPNDIKMGGNDNARILLLTGPNMGGKSTLMRQIAVISIMAQIGSCVPASSCSLDVIDRIFTRLGAQDNIVQGHSTFYMELSEASSILQHATKHSLVLIDELGRGTSTHDGNAIATAYVKKLTSIRCRTIFSTHYHSLVDQFIGWRGIQLGHMACMVENDSDPTQESVTFLYKIAEGRCPKSYGFNAARLAGLNRHVVLRGREVAKELEMESKLRNTFRNIFTSQNISDIRKILASVM